MSAPNTPLQLLRGLSEQLPDERRLMPAQTLFRAGAPVRRLFAVICGEVRLVRHPEVGQALTLQRATAGALVAEASLFSPRYHCDAVAATDTVVAVFKVEAIRAALSANPDALLELARQLASAVVDLRSKRAQLGIRSATARLLGYLDLCADAEGRVELQGPWSVVASEIGLSQEVVYRALAALVRSGDIKRDGRRVELVRYSER